MKKIDFVKRIRFIIYHGPAFSERIFGILESVQHLTDDHLEDYLLAKIPEGIALILVEDHLFRCERCFARFQRTETYFRIMDVDLNAGRKLPMWETLTESARRGLANLRIRQRFSAS